MRGKFKRLQGTWHRLIALPLMTLSICGCAGVGAKALNPLHYTDLIGDNQQSWELFVWFETEKIYVKFPCAAAAKNMDMPKTNAVHAFSGKGIYNHANNVVIYPLGDIGILYHEYIHARNSVLDKSCLSEVFAQHVTKRWASKRSKRLETLFAHGPK